jgi:hypothetical protein
MKKLYIITVLALFYQSGNAQTTVISSCYAPDSIVELYQLDADYLTVTKFYDSSYNPAFAPDSNSIYVPSFSSDSIGVNIPKHLSDSILKALVAVYNATEIPERDTVIDLFEIHTHREFDLNRFSVYLTGNSVVDSLTNLYDLYTLSYTNDLFSPFNLDPFAFSEISRDPSLQDSTQYPYYPLPLLKVSWYSFVGTPYYRDIEFEFHEEYTTLIYIYSWDFKQSLREWEFRIYPDCSLEFVGAIGPPIPQEDNTVSIGHKTEFKTKLYPNPTTGLLNIEAQDFATKVVVTDVLGKVQYQATIVPASTNTLHLQELSLGTYFLQLVDEQGNLLFNDKFLKVK